MLCNLFCYVFRNWLPNVQCWTPRHIHAILNDESGQVVLGSLVGQTTGINMLWPIPNPHPRTGMHPFVIHRGKPPQIFLKFGLGCQTHRPTMHIIGHGKSVLVCRLMACYLLAPCRLSNQLARRLTRGEHANTRRTLRLLRRNRREDLFWDPTAPQLRFSRNVSENPLCFRILGYLDHASIQSRSHNLQKHEASKFANINCKQTGWHEQGKRQTHQAKRWLQHGNIPRRSRAK